jgi:hypothetical protein
MAFEMPVPSSKTEKDEAFGGTRALPCNHRASDSRIHAIWHGSQIGCSDDT